MMRARLLLALAVAAASLGFAQAGAQDRFLPVPRAVIYPGETIHEEMLDERGFSGGAGAEGAVAASKQSVVGKIARRTLLPDRPIPMFAVDSPRVVSVNSSVKIVYADGGLTIVAYGSALQAGGVGDFIRVRNQDSGLIVTGRILADGSVRVSEG
jgi:flagella basal body P-ring formation protein FlgA